MVSNSTKKRVRKPASERREEILAAAAAIALESGLERVTVRAVAEALGVQPGLIGHYYPANEDLVVAAFERAAEGERENMVPAAGGAIERLRGFVHYVLSEEAQQPARLWMNVRHLCRFTPAFKGAIERQETHDRLLIEALIRDGLAEGALIDVDPGVAAVQMLMAFDGFGAYANTLEDKQHGDPDMPMEPFFGFVARVTEMACGLERGVLA